MKITITQDFDSIEDAAAFLAHVTGGVIIEPAVQQTVTVIPDAVVADAAPKTRKPRADAGKPRGPHKTTGEPAASEPGVGGQASAASPQPAAPATPTPTAAPTPTSAGPKDTTPASAPAAATAPPTHDDAHVALKRLSNTPGKGMDACIAVLKAFGVSRRTELPKERLADFLKEVDAQIEQQTKANALAKAAK